MGSCNTSQLCSHLSSLPEFFIVSYLPSCQSWTVFVPQASSIKQSHTGWSMGVQKLRLILQGTVGFLYNESVLKTSLSWHLILFLCFYVSLWCAQVWMLSIQWNSYNFFIYRRDSSIFCLFSSVLFSMSIKYIGFFSLDTLCFLNSPPLISLSHTYTKR